MRQPKIIDAEKAREITKNHTSIDIENKIQDSVSYVNKQIQKAAKQGESSLTILLYVESPTDRIGTAALVTETVKNRLRQAGYKVKHPAYLDDNTKSRVATVISWDS